jgi:hypothetical protein
MHLAQSYQDTGHYQSNIFQNHNLFGMKEAKKSDLI